VVTRRRDRDRGQGHTLEAVAAAFLLVASVGFALQMTAVTPLSASTSSQHLENQLRFTASGVLASAEETGGLSRAVRYWNDTGGGYWNSPNGDYYTNAPPNNTLGNAFNRTFDERNVAYNVWIVYQTSGGITEERRLIYRGQPTDHAIRVSRTVTIMDRDPLIDADGSVNGTVTVSDADTYFLQDTSPGEPIRNVVRVEVVAWRI
jgi:hypothetical protein